MRYGLLGPDGEEYAAGVLELTEAEQTFVFDNLPQRPIPSLLRGFSAPVKLDYPYTDRQLQLLLQHDQDGFNRWDAGQRMALRLLQQLIETQQKGGELSVPDSLVASWRAVLTDDALDPAMVAQLLRLPTEAYLAEQAEEIDVQGIHQAREFLRGALGSGAGSGVGGSLPALRQQRTLFTRSERHRPSQSEESQPGLSDRHREGVLAVPGSGTVRGRRQHDRSAGQRFLAWCTPASARLERRCWSVSVSNGRRKRW